MKWMAAFLIILLSTVTQADLVDDTPEVEMNSSPALTGDSEWNDVSAALKTSFAAKALDEYLLKNPRGSRSAKAMLEKAHLEENLEKVRGYYEIAAAEDPGGIWGAQAVLEMGKMDYAVGRYEKALLTFDSLVPGDDQENLEPELLFWRAQSRFVLKGVNRARTDFLKLVEKYPRHELSQAARLGAAECALSAGDMETAYAEFKLLGRSDSKVGAQALWQAAQVLERQGNPAKSLEHYRDLVARFPESFESTQAIKKIQGQPPAPRATATPEPENSGKFSIQVGAFSKKSGAEKYSKILQREKLTVKVLYVPGNQYHVVRVGSFSSKGAAEKFAASLKSRDLVTSYLVVSE